MTAAPLRYVAPLAPEEHAEVVFAVQTMIDVLPEGDDERGQARARLVSALEYGSVAARMRGVRSA